MTGAANRLGVACGTARNQLKNAFQKTETHRRIPLATSSRDLSKDVTRVCKLIFDVLNQSWIKSLDDFDTTWLVALHGKAEATPKPLDDSDKLWLAAPRGAARTCALFGKFFAKYFIGGEVSLHPKCGSLSKRISPSW